MAINILLVEDSIPLRAWLARVLQRAGHVITQAGSGEEALALLQQTGAYRPPFDVVISDIVMGEIDGVRVTQVARSHVEPPEVILLTGHGDFESATKVLRFGAFDYLRKPVQPSLLLERVAQAAERRRDRLTQAQQAAAWRAVTEVIRSVQAAAHLPSDEAPPPKSERYCEAGRLLIDTQRHEVRFDGALIVLTPIEYTILSVLAKTPGVVVAYGALVQHSHGIVASEREAYGLLRTHVRNLRHKIEPSCLISVRGVGYMLDAPGGAESQQELLARTSHQ